ncbi:hypothetical protein AXI71_gp03 [Lactococcus phage GE1]|uniref:Uncharacterized protein n=1 Tax=Lactococcus phage GE1 TaxID=1698369 RepID=A0A0N9BAS8_9CAUD|nr:hypothetical protein AXI71_gp03 [Lactococcus phage GE1]ALA06957.1 hypothetical protein [Lactococcus phage GE1]
MDYLERKAVVTAVEIQRDLNNVENDMDFLERQLQRLETKRKQLILQRNTLKKNYKECKL